MTNAGSGISPSRAVRTFLKVGTCSEGLFNVVDRAFDNPLELEERASMPFAGGIVQLGHQCGLIWGAAFGAGAQAFRHFGPGPQAETAAVVAAERLVKSFRGRNGHIDCLELIDADWQKPKQVLKYFLKGGPIRCLRMSGRFAPDAFREISTLFSGEEIEAPSPPVSCASQMAQKMGAIEKHIVMAAGLAGGIGLSGSACGALGAAMWITGMKYVQEGKGEIKMKNSWSQKIIGRFLKCTDREFKCFKIVGRIFENVGDHAGYLRDGGCSELIEVLSGDEGSVGGAA